ncbi:MAG: transposase [Chlorobiaceae bacterium]|nr:transposase [Chlorobiaceae bacterium]
MSEAHGNAEPQLRNKDVNEWRSRGYLPHRDCFGLLQSITCRLADSLPQEKLRQLDEELVKMKGDAELGLRVPSENGPELGLRVPGKDHISSLETEKHKRIEAWLDAGMGCCALRHPQMAAVMQDTLLKFDQEKYHLLAWCIMPNHLHVLIEPKVPLSAIVQSWKSFTGRWAMKYGAELGLRAPRFWMPDYWDRYIRDEKHLRSVIDYIHNNPVKAGLCRKETDWPWSSAYIFNPAI